MREVGFLPHRKFSDASLRTPPALGAVPVCGARSGRSGQALASRGDGERRRTAPRQLRPALSPAPEAEPWTRRPRAPLLSLRPAARPHSPPPSPRRRRRIRGSPSSAHEPPRRGGDGTGRDGAAKLRRRRSHARDRSGDGDKATWLHSAAVPLGAAGTRSSFCACGSPARARRDRLPADRRQRREAGKVGAARRGRRAL